MMDPGSSLGGPEPAVPALSRAGVGRQPAGPVVLIVLDGVGIGRGDEFDAVATASTSALDALGAQGHVRGLRAHGPAVGLASESDMGNSEVGHNTLGAGRVFDQGANQVDKAIRSGRIWGPEWRRLVGQARRPGAALHLIGLLSDGNVHSSTDHLFALLHRAAEEGVARVRVHVLLDGRDVADFTADKYVERLEQLLEQLRKGFGCDARIASGGGRMTTTMDRYGADWYLVEAGWRAHVLGTARPLADTGQAIAAFRREQPGISDQGLPAFTVVDGVGSPIGAVADGDAVLVFNFRGDRAIEISEAFTEDNFEHFDRQRQPKIAFAAMTLYDAERGFPAHYLVQPEQVAGTVSELLAAAGVTQFACAETQKFGHITYFWNGNRSEMFDPIHETYLEIPSDRVPFERRPEMKAFETGDAVAAAVMEGRYGFIRANFAGGDMVGHTADLAATRRAVEAIDAAIARIVGATRSVSGCLVVTADHGNAEDMVQRTEGGLVCRDPQGRVVAKTAHSTNPVRFVVCDFGGRDFVLREDLPGAGLANVAATLVELLGFEPPPGYEPSLLDWSR